MNVYEAPPLDQRLGAAERTVEVLKRRLRAIDAGEEKTLIQRQLESSQRPALEVERRRVLSELKSAEPQRYSKLLEDDVAARTEQIRTILDHVGPVLCCSVPTCGSNRAGRAAAKRCSAQVI